MAREDLIGALKNAIERGESMSLAKTTLINAGYKKQDVEEAAEKVEEMQKPKLKIPFFGK